MTKGDMQGDSYEHQSQNLGFSMLPSLSTCHAISKNVFKLSVAQSLPVSVFLVKNGHFYNVILD